MSEPLRYIINEQGDRVGVLLDVEDYHRLTKPSSIDPELLVSLSQSELHALAQSGLAPVEQARLDDLLARHAETGLSPHESAQLDSLLEQVDQLNLLKTRARYTLTRQQQLPTAV
jgi:hypothetical protein